MKIFLPAPTPSPPAETPVRPRPVLLPEGPLCYVPSHPPRVAGDRWLGLLLDVSGSTSTSMACGTRLTAICNAALAAAERAERDTPEAILFLAVFHSLFNCLIDPAPAHSIASRFAVALAGLRSEGDTRFDLALRYAADLFARRVGASVAPVSRWGRTLRSLLGLQAAGGARLVLLFLSDGHNTGANPLPMARDLKAMGVEIHTVGVGASRHEVAERLLKRIASWDHEQGQPHYRFIGDPETLREHFVEVAGSLSVRL